MVKQSQANDRHIGPQPGPQTKAFQSKADILIYGGQAGGGKSWFLVHEPTRRINNPKFRGVIFRRTHPQLVGAGGVWEACQDTYRALGAKLREVFMDAKFPSGAAIQFETMVHEATKLEFQGKEFCYIAFDELTHFTETQFFYMLSRNRSKCGIRPYVRATCNPEPGWVADFLAWWIDPDTGLSIPERSGVIRYFLRDPATEELHWADTKEELLEAFPEFESDWILSVTFINATLDDNPALTEADPGYKGRLMALSKIERDRLLGGNWKKAEGSQIQSEWIRRYSHNSQTDCLEFVFQGQLYSVPLSQTRRIATIDTAGTSKEKAAKQRGKEPSWSICAIWDTIPKFMTAVNGRQVILTEISLLRYVWRQQVDWIALKTGIDETLGTWDVTKAYIENAHFGQALAKEIKSCPVELIGPTIQGMGDHSEGAKLERAIASGMLARWEHGKFFVPSESSDWLSKYLRELEAWTGAPNEVADQIDVTSYCSYVTKRSSGTWGGVLTSSTGKR